MLTYKQKHEQANREALATVGALAVTIIVWAVCGFGLAGLDVQVFHTPLWVIGGTIGTWVCAIVVSVVLAKKFFADFDLGEVEEAHAGGAVASSAATSPNAAATSAGSASAAIANAATASAGTNAATTNVAATQKEAHNG